MGAPSDAEGEGVPRDAVGAMVREGPRLLEGRSVAPPDADAEREAVAIALAEATAEPGAMGERVPAVADAVGEGISVASRDGDTAPEAVAAARRGEKLASGGDAVPP